MKHNSLLLLFVAITLLANAQQTIFTDTAFLQEYHRAYPVGKTSSENEVRSITADKNGNIWIATAAGIYTKKEQGKNWVSPFKEADKGPSYAVIADSSGTIWMGTWNGLYKYQNNTLQLVKGTDGPIAALCASKEGIYAAGPKGVWLYNGQTVNKKDYAVARSVRKIISDGNEGIWLASDVGLYHCTHAGTNHFVDTTKLLTAYVKGLAFTNNNALWAGGLGGVTILNNGIKQNTITPKEGCPSLFVNCVAKDSIGTMWVGTDMGIVRYLPNGKHTLVFSKRWLMDDHVNDIAFDAAGTAWVATANGVSAILKKNMTLAGKQDYFYDVLMKRHIRAPWIVGQCHLSIAGDINSWQPEDDDNDGEFTGNYLAMEAFRYAATKSKDAREKAKKAFAFLCMQEAITGGDGYFARTIVPISWANRVHDNNRTYTAKELADEMVKEPRFKPVETRWRPSKDGKWLWKGDASSDEWCGHMLGYFFYYELAADEAEKNLIRTHIRKLVDHLITHNFNMMDIDGTHTRWSVWSPDVLNKDPEWQPDQNQNSMELLAFLKLAYYVTGDIKYQNHYLQLIKENHYLDNMAKVTLQNPAWFIYYDVSLQVYLYPIFMRCEKDPKLLEFYRQHMEEWMQRRRGDENPLINFLYCYASGKQEELHNSINFLTDTPLDLIDWPIDHTKRADIILVNTPVLGELQVDKLPPASIRQVVRWDKNPWTAVGGNPEVEREPVFWLLPYWMGRYLKMIN